MCKEPINRNVSTFFFLVCGVDTCSINLPNRTETIPNANKFVTTIAKQYSLSQVWDLKSVSICSLMSERMLLIYVSTMICINRVWETKCYNTDRNKTQKKFEALFKQCLYRLGVSFDKVCIILLSNETLQTKRGINYKDSCITIWKNRMVQLLTIFPYINPSTGLYASNRKNNHVVRARFLYIDFLQNELHRISQINNVLRIQCSN